MPVSELEFDQVFYPFHPMPTETVTYVYHEVPCTPPLLDMPCYSCVNYQSW